MLGRPTSCPRRRSIPASGLPHLDISVPSSGRWERTSGSKGQSHPSHYPRMMPRSRCESVNVGGRKDGMSDKSHVSCPDRAEGPSGAAVLPDVDRSVSSSGRWRRARSLMGQPHLPHRPRMMAECRSESVDASREKNGMSGKIHVSGPVRSTPSGATVYGISRLACHRADGGEGPADPSGGWAFSTVRGRYSGVVAEA